MSRLRKAKNCQHISSTISHLLAAEFTSLPLSSAPPSIEPGIVYDSHSRSLMQLPTPPGEQKHETGSKSGPDFYLQLAVDAVASRTTIRTSGIVAIVLFLVIDEGILLIRYEVQTAEEDVDGRVAGGRVSSRFQ